MITRPTKVRFLNQSVKDAYLSLKNKSSEDRKLYKWITQAIDDLKQNGFCGVAIPKDRIPKKYQQEFEKHSIWKYDLPSGYRLIYTIENDSIQIYSIILEWFDHKSYQKRFNY